MYGVTGYGQRPYGYIKWQDVYVTDPNGTGSSQSVSVAQSQSKNESGSINVALNQYSQVQATEYLLSSASVTVTQVSSVAYNITVPSAEQDVDSVYLAILNNQSALSVVGSVSTDSSAIEISYSIAVASNSTDVKVNSESVVVKQAQGVNLTGVEQPLNSQSISIQETQGVNVLVGSVKTESVLIGSAAPQSVSVSQSELGVSSVAVFVGVVYKVSSASCEALIDSVEVSLAQTQLLGLNAAQELFEGDVINITLDGVARQDIEVIGGSQSSESGIAQIALSSWVDVRNCNQYVEVREVNTEDRKDFNPSNLKVTLVAAGFTIFNVTKNINARNETKRISIRR